MQEIRYLAAAVESTERQIRKGFPRTQKRFSMRESNLTQMRDTRNYDQRFYEGTITSLKTGDLPPPRISC
jgi:hypothetical protein